MPLTNNKSMLNKWDYSGLFEACYSDPKQESYKKSAEFLGSSCEDWGCGTGWAKRFFKNYKGIDGSPSSFIKPEEVVDLVNYNSNVDNILMRQVLELNTQWKKILKNVKKSFKKKFCLVIFTPPAEITHIGSVEHIVKADGTILDDLIYVIYFNRQDILKFFPSNKFRINVETIKTNQGYGEEWILYVERI